MKRIWRALAAALFALAVPANAGPKIAITFDDLPAHGDLPPGTTRVDVAKAIIAALTDAHAPPVYGFVNGQALEGDPDSKKALPLWLGAGFPLANHTYSHFNLDQRSALDWEADTLKNEALLARLMGEKDWHWLRFPYLAEGETLAKHTAVRTFLAEHGYRIAAVTLSFDDYLWNDPYARCAAKGDDAAIAQLQTAWLEAAQSSLAYEHNLSMQLYGRDIDYVLLMHIGAFDARMLPQLLGFYRANGVELISLEEAMRDPFYRIDADPRLPPGPVTLEQAMRARGLSFSDQPAPTLPFDTLCR